MPTDITVYLEDRPGELARMAAAVADAGVNIDGFAGLTVGGRGELHVLVEDAESAQAALKGAGIEIGDVREVLVKDGENRPGGLARIAKGLSDSGVSVNLAYLAAEGTKLVLGVDDIDKARSAS